MSDDVQHWFTDSEIEWLFGLNASALEQNELIFSVICDQSDQRLFPAYQFNPEDGHPWPAINSLRLQFEAAGLIDWLPVWLEEPNSAFKSDPPAINLGDHPERVIAAASRFLLRHQNHHQSPPFAPGNQSAA